MIHKTLINHLLALVFLLTLASVGFAQNDAAAGKELFKAKCAACHNRDMKTKLVGPGLAGVEGRWKKEDLYAWIRDSKKMVDAGNEQAVKVFEEYSKIMMTPFPDLTDADIGNILAYIEEVAPSKAAVKHGGDAAAGKEAFKSFGCAACHNANMKDKLVGPALKGVEGRWEKKEDLIAWMKDSKALIDAGHPYATKVFEANGKIAMPATPNLTDADAENILAYIYEVSHPKKTAKPVSITAQYPSPSTKSAGQKWVWYILGLVTLLALFMFGYLSRQFNYKEALKTGDTTVKKANIFNAFTYKPVVTALLTIFVVAGGFYNVPRAVHLGRQQGYQPEQPIKFSHVIHATDNKIDCEFCHTGARRSKHSVIPAASTCMLCHKAIKKGTRWGTKEISKIYASVGFDPNKGEYIPNHENMSDEEYEKVFKNILADYVDVPEGSDKQAAAEAQWSYIKESLTSDDNPHVKGPIEWIRIHALPDHVYYNHSQHVNVAGLECQTCHGPVEKMEEVYQYAPLSMGWCVNCHRQTGVKFEGNKYYESYEKLHQELKDGTIDKVTVEDIGGTDCQRCHY